MQSGRSAIVLLSGGLDSTTAAAWALREGWALVGLTIDYGQRHRRELAAADRVAAALGLGERLHLGVDLRALGGSALTADVAVPKDRSPDALGGDIPITYVPARNTVFLALALAAAEARGADGIVLGVNVLDYSGYPDCRPAYLDAFAEVARLGTRVGVEGRPPRLLTPLLGLGKAEIVRLGRELGAPLAETLSCYDPPVEAEEDSPLHCGRCDACTLRRRGFAEADVLDPTRYQA